MKSFALALVLITTAQPAVSALPRLALEAYPDGAKALAERHGDPALAAAIERDLARIR